MSLTKPPKRRRGFFGASDQTDELPSGSLPCRSCGVAVVPYADTVIETLTIHGQRNAQGFGTDVDIRVTRCNVCADRRDRAALILRDHPAVAREHGNVGIDRLDAALAALDVIGRPGLTESLTATDGYLHDLIAALAAIGGWSAWSATSAAPAVCASRRWSHVSDLMWEDARSEFAGLLQRRMERPKPIAPPSGHGVIRGCGFCGIGAVIGKESATHAIWGDEYRLPLASLGGRGGEVLAHLCPVCRPSLLASGNAVGLPAAWLSAIRFRGYEPRSSAGVVSLSGVAPWAVLSQHAQPNERPWEHIDLAALDNELKFTMYVRKTEAAR